MSARFLILVYPVITMGPLTHLGSKQSLLGRNPTDKQVALFSNEKQVSRQTPPTFIAHAKDDKVVPPENSSQLFLGALREHDVPAEYLELPRGGHGLDRYQGPMWEAWQSGALKWLVAQ